MPHRCADCGRLFADGSNELLRGCPSCGGKRFESVSQQALRWEERMGAKGMANVNNLRSGTIPLNGRGLRMGLLSRLFRPDVQRLKSDGDVDGLVRALRHRDWHVRLDAAEALGAIGDERSVDALILALRDESRHVRRVAAEALAQIGDRRALGPLVRALRSEWEEIDLAFVDAIERLGDRSSIEPLLKSLRYKSRWIHQEVNESLVNLQDTVKAEPLVESIVDRDRNLEWNSELLRRIGDAREIEPIAEGLDYESKLQRWRAEIVGREEASVPVKSDHLEEPIDELRLEEIRRRIKGT